MHADRAMARPLHTSDDIDEETESGISINNVLSNNSNDAPPEELIHSDDEHLQSNLAHVPTFSDAPIVAPTQLKDDATHATPTKTITKIK